MAQLASKRACWPCGGDGDAHDGKKNHRTIGGLMVLVKRMVSWSSRGGGIAHEDDVVAAT
jgi:hypothetical protein